MLKKFMGNREEASSVFIPEKDENDSARFNAVPGAYGASRPAAKSTRTVIGENITIKGDIRGSEDLVIDGSMKGNIELEKNQLTVGPKGRVEAEIYADNVTISGHLTGNIKSRGKVVITREADFCGEIKAGSLSVEDGAYLKAVIELERPEQAAGADHAEFQKSEAGMDALPDDDDEAYDADDNVVLLSKKM